MRGSGETSTIKKNRYPIQKSFVLFIALPDLEPRDKDKEHQVWHVSRSQ